MNIGRSNRKRIERTGKEKEKQETEKETEEKEEKKEKEKEKDASPISEKFQSNVLPSKRPATALPLLEPREREAISIPNGLQLDVY